MKKKEEDNFLQLLDDTFNIFLYTKQESLERAIDCFLNNKDNNIFKDTFESIPGIGEIYSIAQTGVNIQNRIFLEKLFAFIGSVNQGIATESERKKYLEKMGNEKDRQRVGKTIFNFLDSFNEAEKSNLLGKLFSNWIIDKYSFYVFIEFASILKEIKISDINILKLLYEKRSEKYLFIKNKILEENIEYDELLKLNAIKRFINLNLINNKANVPYSEIKNPEDNMKEGLENNTDEDPYFFLEDNFFAIRINTLGILFYENVS